MKYRRIRPEDSFQIERLCAEHKVIYDNRKPLIGFVAEQSDGKLSGLALAHSVILLEPFVTDPDLPTVAVKLFYQIDGAISALGNNTLVAHVPTGNNSLVRELDKVGFVPVSSQYTLLKKIQ